MANTELSRDMVLHEPLLYPESILDAVIKPYLEENSLDGEDVMVALVRAVLNQDLSGFSSEDFLAASQALYATHDYVNAHGQGRIEVVDMIVFLRMSHYMNVRAQASRDVEPINIEETFHNENDFLKRVIPEAERKDAQVRTLSAQLQEIAYDYLDNGRLDSDEKKFLKILQKMNQFVDGVLINLDSFLEDCHINQSYGCVSHGLAGVTQIVANFKDENLSQEMLAELNQFLYRVASIRDYLEMVESLHCGNELIHQRQAFSFSRFHLDQNEDVTELVQGISQETREVLDESIFDELGFVPSTAELALVQFGLTLSEAVRDRWPAYTPKLAEIIAFVESRGLNIEDLLNLSEEE